ncbi:S8 family serine peptidase [Oceanobacillus sp. FSL K6-2867]|uniref:S8 family serine peptidase n=1 Tax=Oceanobacillus sp. FSL K6-2867 TaxID=2954748 RepID=UPI0030DDA258
MKQRYVKKLFSSLLIFTLILSLFNPLIVTAETNHDVSKQLNIDDRISQLKNAVSKQQALLNQEPVLHPSLQNLSSDKEVAVIVQLSEAPVALEQGKKTVEGKMLSGAQATTVKNKVINEQARFERLLKADKIDYEKGFTYTEAFNGMSLKMNANDIDKLLTMEGVVSVDPDEEVHALEVAGNNKAGPMMIDTVPHLEVPQLWDLGHEGQGVKVAVLDTGIDYNHPDFQEIYKGGHNFIEHTDDYARPRNDDDPYETTPEDRPEHMPEFSANGSSFYTSHGTHVAGIIAGTGNNEYGIKGIAPKIDLYAYRVLGAYGSGFTSGIIAAIDKSVEEDMDIINLSLGGGSNSQTAPDAIAINNATLAGVTAIVATGNSGPGRGTVGNPASAALAISVGNSTLPEDTIQASLDISAGEYQKQYDAALMGWNFAENPADALSGTYDVVPVPGVGASSDYEEIDIEGRIALVARGEIPFVDKIEAAKEFGAIGILIHNNIEGEGPANVLLGSSFGYIPAFDISTADGQALREAIASSADNIGEVTFSDYQDESTDGDQINPSSSRGPATPVFDIKPDVSAPGTNIMATVPAYGKDYPDAAYAQAYDRKTGTSMAAPQVAGIAALLLSKNPDWTPYDIKVALSNTAKQLNTEQYDVFAQGPGRVQPLAAANAEALAYALDTTVFDEQSLDYEKGTITFGRVAPDPEKALTITKQIEVRDLIGKSSDFDVSVDVTKAATGELDDASVTVNKSAFTLNGTETLDVTLSVPAGEESPGNELLGYIHITNGTTNLALPFAVNFSTEIPSGLAYFEINDYAISPNNDGQHDETSLEFGLLADEELMSIELWDAANPNGGYYDDGYIGYLALQALPAGEWQLPIGETYYDWETEQEMVIPDGVYTVDFNSWDIANQNITLLADDGPFYVKTALPQIDFAPVEEAIDGNEFVVTGSIDDKFIDFKKTVEKIFGLTYDVNEKLSVTYELTDDDGHVLESNDVTLEQDGTFKVQLTNLTNGKHNLALTVTDIVANSAQQQLELDVTEEEAKEITISLTPSTNEQTEEPVTISVDTDSEAELVKMKWLQGDKTAEDFAEAGNLIDLDTKAFEVHENGTYTVYVQNSEGVEAVESITIENIIDPVEEEIAITLSPSTIEPTEGPISISVDSDSEAELVAMKWLEGDKAAADFAESGNTIDLNAKSFDVHENGIYTVYVQNSNGTEAVQTITIENITDPVEEEIAITLSPSTIEPTEGPVSISVDSDSEAELVAMKWLEGDKAAADFAESGNTIDLNAKSFDVHENGIYTVYVQNSNGTEAVQTIAVGNIIVQGKLSITLSPSTTKPTEGPVSISVITNSEKELTALKWLTGELTEEDFADDGDAIDLKTMTFDIAENGSYTVYAKNSDGLEAVQTIVIDTIIEPGDEIINISLIPSTTAPTEGAVTVSIDTDSAADLAALKWLEGEHSIEDFAKSGAGNAIDLNKKAFDITENGTYTVYAKNTNGAEAVQSITVTNITDPAEEEFTITLSPSTTESTKGPVTISVATDSETDLAALKWLTGEKTAEDFAEDGHAIDLETKAFDVNKNGMYTVYAKNRNGVEAIQTIHVENISKPAPKEDTVITKPQIKDGAAVISNDAIDKLADDGTFIINLDKVESVRIDITKEQVAALKAKEATLIIQNHHIEMQIPLVNLPDDKDISINLEKQDGVKEAVSPVYDLTIYANKNAIDIFKEPISLIFTIDANKVNHTDALNVYYLNEETEQWELIPGAVYRDGKVSVNVDHFSQFAVFEDADNDDKINEPADRNQVDKDDKKNPTAKDPINNNRTGFGNNTGNNPSGGMNTSYAKSNPTDGNKLPNTATATYNYLAIGAVLIIIGLVAFYMQQRRKRKSML